MKSGRTLVDLARELERQIVLQAATWSFPRPCLQCRTDEGGDLKLIVDAGHHLASGGVRVAANTASPASARRQLADKLKIPFAYFERMRAGQPVLLDRNVNTWLQTRRRPPDDPHAGRPGEGGAV
jgi:hypothetical protein